MAGLSKPGADAGDVAALLSGDPQLEDLSRQLLTVHLRPLTADDPDVPRLATALALPRSFDAEIVAVLRGHANPPRDQALLDHLRQFSLVLIRRDGSLAYHDTVRHTLLEEWYRDAPEEAAALNRRLVAYHEARLAEAEKLERDLREVGELIAEANPTRCAALIAAVRTRTLSALREAQHHSIALSSQTGREFLALHCQRLEAAGRFSLCAALVRMARDDFEHLAIAFDDAASFLRRIEYWEARIAAGRGQFVEALERLEALQAEKEGQDDQLRLWTLLLLASTHRMEGNRQQSRAALKRAVSLIKKADPDPHNAPVAYDQTADLEEMWLEFGAARASRLQAAEKARAVGNLEIEINSYLGLARLSAREGDRRDAISQAFRALDLACTTAVRDGELHSRVLGNVMPIIGRASPSHVPTMHAELAPLRRDANDDGQPDYSLEVEYAEAARVVGLLTLAGEILDGVEKDAGRNPSTSLCYVAAEVRREQGRLADARSKYAALIDDPAATRYDRAAGWTNKGLAEIDFDPAAAEQDLSKAAGLWEQMGHTNYVSLTRALRARALALLNRVDEAGAELAFAEKNASERPLELEASLQASRAYVARAHFNWGAAIEAETAAAETHERIGSLRDEVVGLWRAAGTLDSAARWDDAAALADKAARAWRDIARRDKAVYERPAEMDEGDRDDAAGVRALFRTDGSDDLHRARASFRAAADRVRDDPWYNLRLAYTCAALGDWTEAQYALDRVIAQGEPWNDDVLGARRDEFRTQRELAGQEPGEDQPRLGLAFFRKVLGLDRR
jgi:hypothetical protein